MSNKSLENIFKFASAILIGVAVFFFWQGNNDGAFVSAAVGIVAFFLSYRYKLKEDLERREAERKEIELQELNMNRNMLQENTSLFDVEETAFEKGREKVLHEK